MKNKSSLSRRTFLGRAATIGAVGAVSPALIHSCAPAMPEVDYNLCSFLDQAPDGPVLKAGLIGCGGRGTGAAMNFLDAGPSLKIVALADLLPDKLEATRKKLTEEKDQEIADDKCFIGFDAYEKILATDIDSFRLNMAKKAGANFTTR